ncbi:MAG: homing endonuclease associated repeat-containing protein [Candidatus Acidiferrales bacterium]
MKTVLAELKRLALVLNKNGLSRRDIDKHGRVSSGTVIKRFGSLSKGFSSCRAEANSLHEGV